MTTTTWTGTNGNWTDPTWSDGVPDATLDAIIAGTSASPDTVTFNTPSGAAHSLDMTNATLAMAGGTLSLGSASTLDALIQSGGALDFAAGGTIDGALSQSGGALAADSGTLLVDDGGTFAGSLAGAGEIKFAGRPVTLDSGLELSVGTLVIADTTTLAGNLIDTGGFTLASAGTLDLAGHTFETEQHVLLSGLLDGPGTLEIGLRGVLKGLTVTDGATIDDPGTLNAYGLFTLGTSATDHATLFIGGGPSGGKLFLQAGSGIAGNGTILIGLNGGFGDDATSGTISVAGDVTNDDGYIFSPYAGTLFQTVVSDTLLFSAGTFTDLGFGNVAANTGNVVFGPGVTVTNLANGTLTGGNWYAYDGTIALTGGPITTLDADVLLDEGGVIAGGNGTTFTPLQQSLTRIASGGTLGVGPGSSYVTKNDVVVDGTLGLSGGDQFGILTIGSMGELFESGSLMASSIRSAGTVIASGPNAAFDTVFDASFASTGTLEVLDQLALAGANNFLDGAIGGNGTLILDPGSTTTVGPAVRGALLGGGYFHEVALSSGATLVLERSVPRFGTFNDVANGAASTLDLAGHAVNVTHTTFGGSALIDGGGTFAGVGTMALDGLALDGGTHLLNRGIANQTGSLVLGDPSGGTASIVNSKGATWDITNAVSISAASATADTISNAGLFEMTGTGTATIGAAFTNTGTIEVTSGTLEITAPFTNTGTIIGTEIQSGGTTFITAPSATLFHQYAAAMEPAAASAPLVMPASLAGATMKLAVPHSG